MEWDCVVVATKDWDWGWVGLECSFGPMTDVKIDVMVVIVLDWVEINRMLGLVGVGTRCSSVSTKGCGRRPWMIIFIMVLVRRFGRLAKVGGGGRGGNDGWWW